MSPAASQSAPLFSIQSAASQSAAPTTGVSMAEENVPPRMVQPRMVPPIMVQPRMVPPRMVQPRMVQSIVDTGGIFDDSTPINTIVAQLFGMTEADDVTKIAALNKLSVRTLCNILNSTLSEDKENYILSSLSFWNRNNIVNSTDPALNPRIKEKILSLTKTDLQSSSRRRRSSLTGLAHDDKNKFAQGSSCALRGVGLNAILAMCKTFKSLNFCGLSQRTSYMLAHNETESEDYGQLDPVGIIIAYKNKDGSYHFNAFIKHGDIWYNADDTYSILRRRKYGQPTWKTRNELSHESEVMQMIYCYSSVRTGVVKKDIHGYPTFSQSGTGSCGIDALSSVLCFADGFAEIMGLGLEVGVDGGINDIILRGLGHSRNFSASEMLNTKNTEGSEKKQERIDVSVKNVARKITLLSGAVVGPILTEFNPPAQENILPISTAEPGTMFFSTRNLAPSSELLTRFIKYLSGTYIRFALINIESTLGPVDIEEDTSAGLGNYGREGLKSAAMSQRLRKTLGRSKSKQGLSMSQTKRLLVKAEQKQKASRRKENKGNANKENTNEENNAFGGHRIRRSNKTRRR